LDSGATLTLKIERICEPAGTRFYLSGELRSAHLDEVRTEITTVALPVILDLEEVNLVDIEAVRWLNACQAQGVQVKNCAPYIREWMYQETLGGAK
jgi:hypothetical protein